MAKPRASHFPGQPKGFTILRYFQLVFAVLVLAIAAYSVYFWGEYLGGAGATLSLFTSLATIITIIYIFVATYGAQGIYNYWAILGLEIFCLVFWLISFAITAANAAALASYYGLGDVCYEFGGCFDAGVGVGAVAATAGLGGLMFVFFIISLSIYATFLVRHRKAGGHSSPTRMGGVAPQAYEPNSTIPETKYEMQPQTTTNQVYNQQPQQEQYAPQQQYAPQHQPYQQQSQYIHPQATGTTNISNPATPAQHYQQPIQYAQPAQYENGPQQLDGSNSHYVQQ